MKNKNTLTVIIPTYKRPRQLKRAILSVMKQNYPDVKIRVFDNNSGDETEQVVADLMRGDSRVSYHCHERNIGAPANFSFGANQVDTDFFAFLSDDDIVMPDCYRDAIKVMAGDTDIMMVASKVLIIDEYHHLMGHPLSRYKSGRFGPLKAISTIPIKQVPAWTGMVFNSDVIAAVGVPDSDIFILDAEYVTKICYHFPFFITDNIGGIFTVTQAGHKNDHYFLEKPEGREKMYGLFRSEYNENKAIWEMWEWEREKHYKKLFKRGLRWIHEGKYKDATEAAAILANYQSEPKGKFLLWVSGTTGGKCFFKVAIKPFFQIKYYFKNRKPPDRRGRSPSNDEEIKCINYFKSLEREG